MSIRLVKGTPVVSLADGSTLGAIDHVYFDPARLAVVGFTFHQGGGIFGGGSTGLVDIADVHAFGSDAVTIDDASVVRSEVAIETRRSELLDLESLLHRTVITDGGTRVGRVAAIQFGDASHRLTAIDVVDADAERPYRIPAEKIRTIGEEWIIVADADAEPAARRPLRVVTTQVPARTQPSEALGA
jgi:sporulation protein YlmC with PRC-barrel domain